MGYLSSARRAPEGYGRAPSPHECPACADSYVVAMMPGPDGDKLPEHL